MIRGNQIGADVYNTSETELDKNNLSTQKSETERRVAFPELSPGRALIDVETGTLYEFMDRPVGMINTVEGRQSESEEYLNWKYRTPEGQDWGGIIQHHYISYTERACPELNHHEEIQMPLTRPDDSDITTIAPPTFSNSVLFDEEVPRPLLLIERPEVTYEEVMPGDTYKVIGWYDPSESDPSQRTKPTSDIVSMHPEIVGVDSTMSSSRGFDQLDMSTSWDSVDDTDVAIVTASTEGDSSTFTMRTHSDKTEFHVDLGQSGGDVRFLIQSPYEAKETIKSLSAGAQWDSEATQWTVESSPETLDEMIRSFTTAGWELSLSHRVVETFGDSSVDILPVEETVSATDSEVFEYIFTETVSVEGQSVLPRTETVVPVTTIDTEFVEISPTDSALDVTEATQPSPNHISNVDSESERVRFDCPRENATVVKSLNWSEAKYNWIGDDSQWELNESAVESLIEAFCNSGESITLSLTGVRQIGEQTTVTETRSISPDTPVEAEIESYSPSFGDSPTFSTELSANPSDLFGVSPQHPERLALMWIDMKIADEQATGGLSVELGDDPVPELSPSIAEPWQTSSVEDDEYGWYLADTGARIHVTTVDGFGVEYELHVKTDHSSESERIVTLADERTLALAIITQMKCLTPTN